MITLSTIAASICFMAAALAVRDGRYEAALVFAVLFLVDTFCSCLAEHRVMKADKSRHHFTILLGEAMTGLVKEREEAAKKEEQEDSKDGEL